MQIRNMCSRVAALVIAAVFVSSVSHADINCASDIAGCCCRGTRGNVDCDFNDVTDILDLTMLIDHLYISMAPLPSYDEANIDGQDEIDISDITALIDFLYIRLLPLPGCPGAPVNHPPSTRILGLDSTVQPYVNAVSPTSTNPGVLVYWRGEDKLDHPYEPQPLRYQWRMYGPYDSALMINVLHQFIKTVFITTDRRLVPRGQGRFLEHCDTSWLPNPPYFYVTCDTLWVDTVHVANSFGTLDTIFDCENSAFVTNPLLYKIALHSGSLGDSTTLDSSGYLLDLFNQSSNDTTSTGYFMFWVRAIDNDSPPKADPAPAYFKIVAVDGKHERDVLIADAEISYEINPRKPDSAKQYWIDALGRWRPGSTHTYHMISQANGNVLPLSLLLKHKVVVVVNDDVLKGVAGSGMLPLRMITAANGGTEFWLCGRTILAGNEGGGPSFPPPSDYPKLGPWMGITKIGFSGWSWYWLMKDPSARVEDFVGADPFDSTAWPILTVDSAHLHSRYGWDSDFYPPWIDSLAALPEVAGFWLTEEPEILYVYNSIYTDHHPLLISDNYFFDGKPVVYRINRTGYRLFVSSFTPYSLAGDSIGGAAQTFVDSTLNWLYEPFQTTANGYRSEKTTPHEIVAPSEAEEVKK